LGRGTFNHVPVYLCEVVKSLLRLGAVVLILTFFTHTEVVSAILDALFSCASVGKKTKTAIEEKTSIAGKSEWCGLADAIIIGRCP
jgi:hypothetical protein